MTKFERGHLTNFNLSQANDTLVVKIELCFKFLKKKSGSIFEGNCRRSEFVRGERDSPAFGIAKDIKAP